MGFRRAAAVFSLVLIPAALARGGAAATSAGAPGPVPATTQPAPRPAEGYRLLGAGSWIVSDAKVHSSVGFPTQIRRKVAVGADPATGRRVLEESRWSGLEYEATGPARPLPPADGRSFDELNLPPQATLPDQTIVLARRRYLCSVTQYGFRSDVDGKTTLVTLWRDKTGTFKAPARSMSINNHDVPLPPDTIQADFTVEGPRVSTRGTRRIVGLNLSLKVGERVCACLVESTRVQGTSNDKPVSIVTREWFCDDLPGEKVRTQSAMVVGAMRSDSDVTVVDFHAAPLRPLSPLPPGPATRPASAE